LTIQNRGNGLRTGLSTDTKPTLGAGFRFYETDTGDTLTSDGTYWWLTAWPGVMSPRRFGSVPTSGNTTIGNGMIGTVSPATGHASNTNTFSDPNGRYNTVTSGAVSGDRGGYRYNSNLMMRINSPRMRFRFQLPASTDYTLARLYIGMAVNQEMTGDDPLNAANGVLVGFISGGANFQVMRNDGTGATVLADVAASAQALDTAIHNVYIVADEANSRFSVRWDNNAYVHFTTDIPGSTNALTLIYQNETNTAAAKVFRYYNGIIQTER
jgi:hypothetical protein